MSELTISVALPTYNRAELLDGALKSLLEQNAQTFTYEIIVIDDASTDNTREVVERTAKTTKIPVRYVLGDGKGYSHALNTAVGVFKGQWLAFFDDDERADPNWLTHLYTFACESKSYLTGGRVLLDLTAEQRKNLGPVCRGMFGELPDFNNEPECLTKYLPGGGNILINRRVFDHIGRFDQTLLTGGCDRDFVLRARAAGFTVSRTPGAIIHHIIPIQRFSKEYIKWYSLQWGCSFALIDWKRWGVIKAVSVCIARIGQALLINVPVLLLMVLRGNQPEILERKALIWRAAGYSRKILWLLNPAIFSQTKFFNGLQFRKARETFDKK